MRTFAAARRQVVVMLVPAQCACNGYEIAESKIKDGCVEVYARDKQGTRVEYFIDPATGNPVGADWKNPS
jgi:hypothetical protein